MFCQKIRLALYLTRIGRCKCNLPPGAVIPKNAAYFFGGLRIVGLRQSSGALSEPKCGRLNAEMKQIIKKK